MHLSALIKHVCAVTEIGAAHCRAKSVCPLPAGFIPSGPKCVESACQATRVAESRVYTSTCRHTFEHSSSVQYLRYQSDRSWRATRRRAYDLEIERCSGCARKD